MSEEKIQYPGYMERSQGFSIPENKCFYIVSFEDLVYYNLNSGEVTEIDDWDFDETRNVILLQGKEIPFIGLWGGNPILKKSGLGELTLNESVVTLKHKNGSVTKWNLENFSGDWAQVTFDTKLNGFLYGAPYDFDYRYVSIT
ncbi:MAG: hypothetical protein OQL19_04410 [Gammaproteobacteria bacterium]|nr:hypothetical protein [Gammaproteobacteria bacterium]